MGALGWLVARELRNRWRGALAIALVVGLAGGVVLASAAGARRTGSAYDRFVDETATRDAWMQVDEGNVDAILDEVEALDLVESSGRVEMIPVMPTDESLVTDVDLTLLASPDGRWGTDIDRPVVLEGRVPHASATDEVLLNELAAEQTGLVVGDRIEAAAFTPQQLEKLFTGGTFEGFGGPEVDLRVVGIGRQASDLQGSEISQGGMLLVSPALHRDLDGKVGALTGMMAIELAPGATVGELGTQVRRIVGEREFEVGAAEDDFGRSARDAAEVLSRALAAFAVVASIAGAVAVGGAVTRQCAAARPTVRTLESLGCDRRQRTVVGASMPLAGALAGTALAVLGAIAVSDRFPISVARRAEPDPGPRLDVLVLGLGGLALFGAVAAWSVVTMRRLGQDRTRPITGRSWTPLALPPSASIGIGHTFDRRAADRTVPVRAALAAAVLGVLGVVGTATVVRSFDALVDDPARYGWSWSAEPDLFTDDPEALVEELASSPGVEAVGARRFRRVELDGVVFPGFAFESRKAEIAPPLRAGRLPAAANEVVLGQRTADQLRVSVGERIPATEAEGGTSDVEVVGIGVFAPVDTKEPGVGVLFTIEGMERFERSVGFEALMVRYRPGFDASGLERSLMERELADFPVYARPRLPSTLGNLDLVMPIVAALGVFFAVLALAGLTHALVVGTRRRRRELATLRALGMRRGQVRWIVVVTGLATALFGVVVGAPLGLAAGRGAWELVIGSQGVLDAPTIPSLVLLAVAPAALLLAFVVSWWPGASASRRPGHVLRSE